MRKWGNRFPGAKGRRDADAETSSTDRVWVCAGDRDKWESLRTEWRGGCDPREACFAIQVDEDHCGPKRCCYCGGHGSPAEARADDVWSGVSGSAVQYL